MQNYIFPISNLNVYIVGALCYSLFSMPLQQDIFAVVWPLLMYVWVVKSEKQQSVL